MYLTLMNNPKFFIQRLSDSELRNLASEVRKERERRRKISQANNTWICGEGLEAVLQASIAQYTPVPGGRRQPVVASSEEFAEKLEKAILEKFGRD